MKCEAHPSIELPHMLTCPLCAQEARWQAYEAQRVIGMATLAKAAQRLPGPVSEGEP